MSSPAPTRSTTASAISDTTSAPRIHVEPLDPRVPSRRATAGRPAESCQAGTRPNAALAASDTTPITLITDQSSAISSTRGRSSRSGSCATSSVKDHRPTARPAIPPSRPSTALSVRSCRTMRRCPRRAPAERRFRRTDGCAREKQVRDIHAGDQQDECHRAHENHQPRFHRRDDDVLQRIHARVRIRGLRKRPAQNVADPGHVRTRLLDRAVCPQAPQAQQEVLRARGVHPGVELRWNPVFAVAVRETEAGRHDPHDRVDAIAERHRLPERAGGTVEQPPRQAVADDDDRRRRQPIVVGRQRSASRGRDMENVEQAAGGEGALQTLRFARRRLRQHGRAPPRERVERPLTVDPVVKIAGRRRIARRRIVGNRLLDDHEPSRLGVRKQA